MAFSLLGIRLKNSKKDIPFCDNDKFPTIPFENSQSNTQLHEILQSHNCSRLDLKKDGESFDEESRSDKLKGNKHTKDINEEDNEHNGEHYDENNDHTNNEEDEYGEYEIYSKIETHMSLSLSLYVLNRQGNNILKEIDNKKLQRKNIVSEYITCKVYNELQHCVNENRMMSDAYTELINNLDNVLFEECGDMDTFFVKDDEYTLESMYYKQDSWVHEIEWEEPQIFQFSLGNAFDEGECMYLLMYIGRYLKLLSTIDNEYDNVKLQLSTVKLKERMETIQEMLKEALNEFVGNDLEHPV